MARFETERDDLWAEVKAMSPRIELSVRQEDTPNIAGFRAATGGWSIFFGQDPVFHFDGQGRLRRAYCRGLLYRTEGTTLAQLERHRSATSVELQRYDLDDQELVDFLRGLRERVDAVLAGVGDGSLRVVRIEPDDDNSLTALRKALTQILASPEPLAPPIATRKL